MKRFARCGGILLVAVFGLSLASFAHYQLILPSDDYLTEGESTTLELQLVFTHPTGAIHSDSTQHESGAGTDPTSMDMETPVEFGVVHKLSLIHI